jgi:hypothetical protein
MRLRFTHLLPLLAVAACGNKTTQDRFELSLRATSDDATPLSNVAFETGKSKLGATDASGALTVRLRGVEGQTLPITFTCPAGYEPEGGARSLRLTHTRGVTEGSSQPLTIDTTCVRKLRQVVVVVRSENATDLPILVDGKTTAVAADGTAHLLLELDRDVRAVTVALDTSTQPKLRPQNPSRTFDLHGKDAVLVMAQSFTSTKPRPHGTSLPQRHIPYRIQ